MISTAKNSPYGLTKKYGGFDKLNHRFLCQVPGTIPYPIKNLYFSTVYNGIKGMIIGVFFTYS